MTVLSSRRMYSFRAIKPIVLGRPDVQQDFYPDLDLTPEDGVAAGVSRAHARLVFEHGQCSVEDLGSDNGTFVNGFRMTPHGPYRLRSGDQLQLGTLAIEVELHDKPPAPIKLVRA